MKKKQSLLVLILTITLFSLSSLPVNAVQRGSYNNLFFGHLGAAINTVLNLLNYPITIQGYSVGSVRFAALQNIPLWIILAVFFILYSTIFFALKHVKIFQGESARGGRIATALALAVISEFGTTLIPNLWRTLYLVSQLSYALFVFVALTAIYIAVRTYWEKQVYANNANLNAIHVNNFEKNVNTTEKKIKLEKKLAKILGKDMKNNVIKTNEKTEQKIKEVEEKIQDLNGNLKQITAQIAELVKKTENLEQSENNSINTENKLGELKKELENTKTSIQNKNKNIEKLLKKAKELKKTLEAEISKYENKIKERGKVIINTNETLAQMTSFELEEIDKLKIDKEALESDIKLLREEYDRGKNELKEIENITKNVERIQRDLKNGKINLNQVQGILNKIKERILGFSKEVMKKIRLETETLRKLFGNIGQFKPLNGELVQTENNIDNQETKVTEALNNEEQREKQGSDEGKNIGNIGKKGDSATKRIEMDETRLDVWINKLEQRYSQIEEQLKNGSVNNKELAKEIKTVTRRVAIVLPYFEKHRKRMLNIQKSYDLLLNRVQRWINERKNVEGFKTNPEMREIILELTSNLETLKKDILTLKNQAYNLQKQEYAMNKANEQVLAAGESLLKTGDINKAKEAVSNAENLLREVVNYIQFERKVITELNKLEDEERKITKS